MPRFCRNTLIAVMFPVFLLSGAGAGGTAFPDGEQARIDRLLAAVSASADLVFIRNGSEHTAREAADHLRLKLRRAGSRIATAEEFIDLLATRSSFSGKPYLIRRPGRQPEPAGPFLHNLLRNLEQRPPGR